MVSFSNDVAAKETVLNAFDAVGNVLLLQNILPGRNYLFSFERLQSSCKQVRVMNTPLHPTFIL